VTILNWKDPLKYFYSVSERHRWVVLDLKNTKYILPLFYFLIKNRYEIRETGVSAVYRTTQNRYFFFQLSLYIILITYALHPVRSPYLDPVTVKTWERSGSHFMSHLVCSASEAHVSIKVLWAVRNAFRKVTRQWDSTCAPEPEIRQTICASGSDRSWGREREKWKDWRFECARVRGVLFGPCWQLPCSRTLTFQRRTARLYVSEDMPFLRCLQQYGWAAKNLT